MPTIQVVVLAVVQGITEFLPISSTAHLVIVPRLLHWRDPGLGFDIALHFGTLLAVIVYFFPTWIDLVRSAIGVRPRIGTRTRNGDWLQEYRGNRRLFWDVALATVPAMVSGLTLHRAAESSLRTLPVIGVSMISIGVYMWGSERAGRRKKDLYDICLADALVIGIAQAAAVIPGVSRSGSTIATGLFRGLEREAAVRFSFLMSTPIIAGAALVEVRELVATGLPAEMRIPFLLGTVISAIVGYAAIWGLIRYLRIRSLDVFVVYRIAIGALILFMAVHGGVSGLD